MTKILIHFHNLFFFIFLYHPRKKENAYLYPLKVNIFGGTLESACLSVCLSVRVSGCVRNISFCQSAGGGIKSHLVTALVLTRLLKTSLYSLSLSLWAWRIVQQIHISHMYATYNSLCLCYRYLESGPCFDPEFHFTYRGEVKMKGKDVPMKCWFLSRKLLPVDN